MSQYDQSVRAMKRPTTDQSLSYRSDIDGLRAIAVLSVLGCHFLHGRGLTGGFVGVDIFFVISGFLISSIIYKELESGTFSIVEFYVRRIRRIYPALFIVLAFVFVVGWFLLLPSDFVLLGKQIVGGSTFVANFVLWSQAGYFSPAAAQKPLLHLWSLGVEEQFYLVFPLICVMCYRAKSRWTLPAVLLALAIASMVINLLYVKKYSAASYFLPFSRLWELLLGTALSLFQQRIAGTPWDRKLPSWWRAGAGLLGLVLILGSVFLIKEYYPFPGWYAVLPTIGTALAIIAGPFSWINRCILSRKPAVFVGLISYPLYLWHWPIIAYTRVAKRVWDYDLPPVPRYVAMLTASFVLAHLTYRFVEVPVRQIKPRERRRKGALWMLVSVATIGAFGVLVIVRGGFPIRFSQAVIALDHNYGAEEASAYREGSCFLQLGQSAASFASDCLDPSDGDTAQPLVLIWGDSHAADLVPGFRELQHQSRVRLAQYTASMCAPIIGLQVRERPACHSVNYAVLDRIRTLRPNIVVLSAFWDYQNPDNDRAALAEELQHTIETIRSFGIQRVVVIGSAPFWSNDVPLLLFHQLRRNPDRPVPYRLSRSLLEGHDDTQLKAVAEKAGAVYVSIFDELCDQTSCVASTGPSWQDVLTYDKSHFTKHGSEIVAYLIWSRIIDVNA